MAISTFCLGCRSLLRLPDELAGKQVRCQKCNQLFMVPGLLGLGAKPAVKAAPRPDPMPPAPPVAPPRPVVPAAPLAPPRPRPESAPPADGVPAVVLVEVPTRPTPPPLPEQTPDARPSRSESKRRETPPMDLTARGQPRRTNRPRHPSSVMAGLTLTVMGLLFVGLLGVSGATWLVTSLRQPINNGPFVQQQQQPQGFFPNNGGVGNNVIVNPGPPGVRFNDKLATKVSLKNRLFITRSFLTNKDPLDPVSRLGGRQLPCKVFLIDLEQGKQYTIEYTRTAPVNNHFDPYLRIESQDGQRLVEHDDIVQGFNMDSRIVFVPNRTGTFRVFCTLFERTLPEAPPGQWQFTLSVRENGAGPLPTVVPMALPPLADVPLPTAKRTMPRPPAKSLTEGEISVTTLANPPGVETKPAACWSADRQAFFVLYNHPFNVSSVARVAVNGLVEERRLPLTRPGGAMCLSSQGLLVTVPGLNEVWLISSDELKVSKRFGVLNPQAVVSSPDLKYVYVVSSPAIFPELALGKPGFAPGGQFPNQVPKAGPARRGLIILDLQDGSARFQDVPCQSVVVSPNGFMLFAMDEDALHSFEIQPDGALLPKQTGGRLGFQEGKRHLDVSSDSKLVCVSGSRALANLPNHPRAGPCPAYIYSVDDLRKPAFAISTGVVLDTVGIAAKTNRVFAYGAGKPVVVFDMDGRRVADFALPNTGPAQDPSQFLVHPDGNKLLIRFPSKLCFAVFKADVGPLVKVDPKFPAPKLVEDPESFAGKPFKRGAFTYRELQPLNPGAIDPCWDADGQAFYQLDADGTLTRVNADDFLPKIQLAIGRPVSAMALSARGLLVALRDEPEIWVIDARTLKVQRSIVRPSPARFLASHAKLSVAAAVGAEVVLLDLTGQLAVRGLPLAPEPGQSFESPALTPDGTLLFVNQAGVGSSKVLRVRLAPDRLIIEDTKVTPVKASHVFCVTADGKHVAWFSPLVANKKQETAFYAVGDWKAPAFIVAERARAMGAAQDGSLIVNTHQQSTLLFAQPADPKVPPTPLQFPESHVRSFAMHPQQPGVFLASTGKKMYYVQR